MTNYLIVWDHWKTELLHWVTTADDSKIERAGVDVVLGIAILQMKHPGIL